MTTNDLSELTDDALLAEARRVADAERRAMADLLALLIEVERRHLCQKLGYTSLFAYCTQALGLSEQAAYSRITAARAVRRLPAMLPMLADGALTLTSIGLLAPHLTEDNQDALLAAAQYQSSRAVEKIVATVHAQPDIESSIRAVAAGPSASIRPTASAISPIAANRYLLKVTIGQKAHDNLERARALLRHVFPAGDRAALVERALALLVREAERTKFAAKLPRRTPSTTSRSRSRRIDGRHDSDGHEANRRTRAIPAAVRRNVWHRDQGRCAFVGPAGRCSETGFLEFHHVIPFAAGGETSVDNLQLRCRSHNAFEARADAAAGLF